MYQLSIQRTDATNTYHIIPCASLSVPTRWREARLAHPGTTSHTLTGLEVYTQYLISIRVVNPEGEGPDTIVVVMTDEGAPSSPRNVKILSVQSSSLQLSWWEPARPNGVIQVSGVE